jgi:hypothetical protein
MSFNEAVLADVAKAICRACDENPAHRGDARGNEFRWQDYLPAAEAALAAAADGGSLTRMTQSDGCYGPISSEVLGRGGR